MKTTSMRNSPSCIIYNIVNTLKSCQLDLFHLFCPLFLLSPPPSTSITPSPPTPLSLSDSQSLPEVEQGQHHNSSVQWSRAWSGGTWYTADALINSSVHTDGRFLYLICMRLMHFSIDKCTHQLWAVRIVRVGLQPRLKKKWLFESQIPCVA